MSRAALSLLALVAAFAVSVPVAAARNQNVHDRKGDARFGAKSGDIRSVILRHATNDRLSFTIRTRARDRYDSMYQGILVKVGKRRYDIQGTANSPPIKVSEKGQRTPEESGFSSRFRERGKRVTYTITEEAIGNPRSIRWQAWTAGPDPPTIDRAPSKGWKRHMLRPSKAAVSGRVPSLKVPRSVSVGRKMTLRVRGFPRGSKLIFIASLDGPAAFSGRKLGRARTNGSGRAKLRTRFPRTYKWCNSNNDCTTYKWPKGAKIALSAHTKKPPYAVVRKVVPLRKNKRRGGKPGGYRKCSGRVFIPFPGAPEGSGDMGTRIKAKNMNCRKAKRVIKAPAIDLGYRCKSRKRDGFPRITCTKGRKGVKFTYIQY